MSIHFITGKPGAGKGLLTIHRIVEELVHGNRHIITNFAVKRYAWVNGQGIPQMGLEAYLVFKRNCNPEQAAAMCDRVHILADEDADKFFLFRAVRDETGKVALRQAVGQFDNAGKLQSFDTSLLSSGGVLYILDECWKFWGSRNWQKTGEGLQFYNAQHRKTGDDVLLCTQHTKQVDAMIHRVAQDFWVCRNRGKLRIGAFRQPNDIKIAVYENAPTGTQQEPMMQIKMRVDIKGVAQCYDTTAGVGLSGKLEGDAGQKKKGLPFIALVIGLCVAPILFWLVLSRVLHFAMGKTVQKAVSPKTSLVGIFTNRPLNSARISETREIQSASTNSVASQRVTCTGYMKDLSDNKWHAWLSDGREVVSGEGELKSIGKRGIIVGTNLYEMARLIHTNAQPQIQETKPVGFAPREVQSFPSYQAYEYEPRSQVIIFGKRGESIAEGIQNTRQQRNPYFNGSQY